jgi:acyl-CoA synthetase (AMP-forming)/AMP-acid ligase II
MYTFKQREAGLCVGDRAVLLYPPGPEFILAFVGCLFAGVVPVPVYPPVRYPWIPYTVAYVTLRLLVVIILSPLRRPAPFYIAT